MNEVEGMILRSPISKASLEAIQVERVSVLLQVLALNALLDGSEENCTHKWFPVVWDEPVTYTSRFFSSVNITRNFDIIIITDSCIHT